MGIVKPNYNAIILSIYKFQNTSINNK